MNGSEYRAILASLGLAQSAAARLLGIDARSSRRYACGDCSVPLPTSRFLRYIKAVGADPAKVTAMLEELEADATARPTIPK